MLHKVISHLPHVSKSVKILIGALAWLFLISGLHFIVNFENSERRVIKMGYMPVITNLAAPLLDFASKEGNGIRYKAIKYASFAEMAESLRNGEIEVAFMIAPLSIVLKQQGEDVKIIYIGNRHESTMVARKELKVKTLHDLIGKTIAIPMRYSGHNISILDLIEKENLTGQINVVEMNPPDMAAALSTGSLDAYYVGEPFAAQTLMAGKSERVFYVEEVWDKFICNLAVVRQDLIQKEPDVVQQIVNGAVRSGMWASNKPKEAVKIAAKYWNQPVKLLEYAFTTPKNRILYDQYIPKESEMQEMADLMKTYKLLEQTNIDGLVDDRFAKSVKVEDIQDVKSILK
ncbi:MAG: ABC transporter substrate-binding protein [Gammaproteobacteria bacterium]|nr:ABC transporter substrate-binding protein [Gammaproteobacteria bacterium]